MRLGCDNSVALGFTSVGDQFVGALVGVVNHRLAHGDALRFLLPLELEQPALRCGWALSSSQQRQARAPRASSRPQSVVLRWFANPRFG